MGSFFADIIFLNAYMLVESLGGVSALAFGSWGTLSFDGISKWLHKSVGQ